MQLLDEHAAGEYLRSQGWVGEGERIDVRPLAGGVSNQVLHVSRPETPGGDFVLKQAREQLRTPAPWFCGLDRIWREVDVLRVCRRLLVSPVAKGPSDSEEILTPQILHEDRQNYCFAMTAAPRDHRVWKSDLLAGKVDPRVAEACGRLLGRLHAGGWLNEEIAERLADRRVFDELRLSPYYRSVADQYPSDAPALKGLIESVWENPRTLVHADFSPKNLLVYEGGLLLVDFETGHYGDPAFDLGFFLSHLLLKSARSAPSHRPYWDLMERFWRSYSQVMRTRIGDAEWRALAGRSLQNLAGCAWARLDGTSQVDYLPDPDRRQRVRALCRGILHEPPQPPERELGVERWAGAIASP